MASLITLAVIILAPLALLSYLRVNATLVFLSLCLGDVLAQFVGSDVNSLSALLGLTHVSSTLHPTDNLWRLSMLLLPVILTTVFMIHTIKGRSHIILNIIPSAGVGLVGSLLVVPLLPAQTAQNILSSSLWSEITKFQAAIVAVTALTCMIVLWLQRPKTGGGKHGKHSKG